MAKVKKQKETKFKDTEFYFDDCSICRLMKKAEESGRALSSEELKRAFVEAKKKGAVIGGSLLDEKSS